MIDPGDGSRRFKVRLATAVLQMIRPIHTTAARQARGSLVTKALRRAARRLEMDPFQLGVKKQIVAPAQYLLRS